MDYRWFFRYRYRWLRLRFVGIVRLLYIIGVFWFRFFIWRINDNYGFGIDFFYRRIFGFRDLRLVYYVSS